jgi:hypothetical protein
MRQRIKNILNESILYDQKTHPDPWEMSFDEVRNFQEPSFNPSSGMSLLYHGTKIAWNNIDQILENGILMSKAEGHKYHEPNWIWSSLNREEAYERGQSIFTFQAFAEEKVNNSWVRFTKDIPKQDILYCSKYYYFRTCGVMFDGRLEDFKKGKETWHKLCITWAIENGLFVPEKALRDHDWSKWDVVKEYISK